LWCKKRLLLHSSSSSSSNNSNNSNNSSSSNNIISNNSINDNSIFNNSSNNSSSNNNNSASSSVNNSNNSSVLTSQKPAAEALRKFVHLSRQRYSNFMPTPIHPRPVLSGKTTRTSVERNRRSPLAELRLRRNLAISTPHPARLVLCITTPLQLVALVHA